MKIVSASSLIPNTGVKCLVYGPPGTGKTPLCLTAPKPLLISCERGLLSLSGSNLPTVECVDKKTVDEVLKWMATSQEAKKFDTICIDSISEMAEIVLKDCLRRNSHGMAAYGDLGRYFTSSIDEKKKFPSALEILLRIRQHVYLIGKLDLQKEDNSALRLPMIPGNVFKWELPHKIDEVFYINTFDDVPGYDEPRRMFQTEQDVGIYARDRSDKLDRYEEPNLGAVFTKIKEGKKKHG